MRYIGCLLVFALIAGCASLQSRGRLTPDDILVKESVDFTVPERLNRKEIEEDLALLQYALMHAYGGRQFVPKDQFAKALTELRALGGLEGLSPSEFCEKIDDALLNILDFHLSASLNGEDCGKLRKSKTRKGAVGKNISTNRNKPWERRFIDIRGRKIPVFSLTVMRNHEDPAWQGFLETVSAAKRTAPAIIVDLRGNGGGDDAMGRKMAGILYGRKAPSPIESQIKSQTPETVAMLVNNHRLRILRARLKNQSAQDFWHRRLEEALKNYTLAKEGQLPLEREVNSEEGEVFDPSTGYAKPIFLLVDAECASSCESVLEAFESHPHARTVGENSAGFIHFGNIGSLFFKNSKIVVGMATDYWKYKDGRFVEGTGYGPQIRVPAEQDALDVVKGELIKALK